MNKMPFGKQPYVAHKIIPVGSMDHGNFEAQWRADKTVNVRRFDRTVKAGGCNGQITMIVVRRKVAAVTAMIVMALLLAGRVHAEPLKISYAVLAAGQLADIKTTQHTVAAGCVESNPLIGAEATMPRLITLKLVTLAPTIIGMAVLERHGHPKIARRLGYVMGALGGGAAVWNATRSCGR